MIDAIHFAIAIYNIIPDERKNKRFSGNFISYGCFAIYDCIIMVMTMTGPGTVSTRYRITLPSGKMIVVTMNLDGGEWRIVSDSALVEAKLLGLI